MPDTVDLLQVKIDQAKAKLSEDTLEAIAAVPWQAEILKMRETKGYSFEQLNDLEIETELLLCGLVAPADYPKELENRMKINKAQANELVLEMNTLVFSKIKEELIKRTERPARNAFSTADAGGKTTAASKNSEEKNDAQVLNTAGIEIVPEKLELGTAEQSTESREEVLKKVEKPEPTTVPPILAQKLSGSFQIPSVKTEHFLENITKTPPPTPASPKVEKPLIDPYR